jgi:hypothetical protein
MAIKIEKGVAIEIYKSPGAPRGEIFLAMEKMKKGDSFVIPKRVKNSSARTMASSIGKKLGKRFSWSCVSRRIWRIE